MFTGNRAPRQFGPARKDDDGDANIDVIKLSDILEKVALYVKSSSGKDGNDDRYYLVRITCFQLI